MRRYAQRRDSNELPLVRFAERLGARLWRLDEPCDFLMLFRGRWEAVEIKNPEQEGHADEYTLLQREFHAEVFQRGGRVLVWRTKDDCLRDLGGRVAA